MKKDIDKKNKEELLKIYDTIADSKKQAFVKAVEFLKECFMDK